MIAHLLALALLPAQQLQLNLNVKDGFVLTGEKTFAVTVVSKAPVTQVEFYVNDELRETDTSTPYEFKVDSLAEKDGTLKLKFSAYNTEGQSASKSISITVDNQLAKGADFHVTRAREYLTVSKWDDAILSARIALKAQANNAPAQIVMARAYLGKGIFDSAQKFAEDAIATDAGNIEAAELLAVINLHKAFNTYNHPGADRKETLNVISTALKSAVETRRKILEMGVDKIGTPNDANLIQFADAAIKADRYNVAVVALQPAFAKDNRRNDLANRLAYVQLRMGRIQDASNTLAAIKKYGVLDAYGFALLAIVEAERGNMNASDDAMREAVLSEGDNLGVRTAQAYLALKRGQNTNLQQLATQLAKDEGQRSEVHLYLAALYNRLRNYEASRKHFEAAVLAEPANYDIYVERANESIALSLSGRLPADDAKLEMDAAKVLLQTALIARPESQEALTGMSLLLLLQGQKDEALKYGMAAVTGSPSYAPGHYALSAVYSAMGRTPEATVELNRAGALDKANLEGRSLPTGKEAWQHFARHGRSALLVLPK